MKKNGFTLVELVTVVVILALIMILVVPNLLNVGDDTKQASFDTKIQNIESAAQMYGTDNEVYELNKCIEISDDGKVSEKFESSSNNCYEYNVITVKELADENYIKYDKYNSYVSNPKDSNYSLNNDYIYIYKRNNRVYAIYQENTESKEEIKNTTTKRTNVVIDETINTDDNPVEENPPQEEIITDTNKKFSELSIGDVVEFNHSNNNLKKWYYVGKNASTFMFASYNIIGSVTVTGGNEGNAMYMASNSSHFSIIIQEKNYSVNVSPLTYQYTNYIANSACNCMIAYSSGNTAISYTLFTVYTGDNGERGLKIINADGNESQAATIVPDIVIQPQLVGYYPNGSPIYEYKEVIRGWNPRTIGVSYRGFAQIPSGIDIKSESGSGTVDDPYVYKQ